MTGDDIDLDLSGEVIDDDKIAEMIRRKNEYMEERKRGLGPEYYSAKEFWDRMWEAEWDALEERMQQPTIEGREPIPIEFPIIEIEGDEFNLYTFDDFALLHNQGIFRDEKFLIDRQGRWTKNIVNKLEQYGYHHRKTIIVSREKYLLMEVVING